MWLVEAILLLEVPAPPAATVIHSQANCEGRPNPYAQSGPPCRKKAATALKGVVGVGAVNADDHKELAAKFQVRVGSCLAPAAQAFHC